MTSNESNYDTVGRDLTREAVGFPSTQLTQAIARNRARQRRYRRAEQVLRWVRQRVFDFEDQGKLEKAHKLIKKCKKILKPLWDYQAATLYEKRMRNYHM